MPELSASLSASTISSHSQNSVAALSADHEDDLGELSSEGSWSSGDVPYARPLEILPFADDDFILYDEGLRMSANQQRFRQSEITRFFRGLLQPGEHKGNPLPNVFPVPHWHVLYCDMFSPFILWKGGYFHAQFLHPDPREMVYSSDYFFNVQNAFNAYRQSLSMPWEENVMLIGFFKTFTVALHIPLFPLSKLLHMWYVDWTLTVLTLCRNLTQWIPDPTAAVCVPSVIPVYSRAGREYTVQSFFHSKAIIVYPGSNFPPGADPALFQRKIIWSTTHMFFPYLESWSPVRSVLSLDVRTVSIGDGKHAVTASGELVIFAVMRGCDLKHTFDLDFKDDPLSLGDSYSSVSSKRLDTFVQGNFLEYVD